MQAQGWRGAGCRPPAPARRVPDRKGALAVQPATARHHEWPLHADNPGGARGGVGASLPSLLPGPAMPLILAGCPKPHPGAHTCCRVGSPSPLRPFALPAEAHHMFTQAETDWGFADTVTLEDLYNPRLGFSHNNTLIIRVKVRRLCVACCRRRRCCAPGARVAWLRRQRRRSAGGQRSRAAAVAAPPCCRRAPGGGGGGRLGGQRGGRWRRGGERRRSLQGVGAPGQLVQPRGAGQGRACWRGDGVRAAPLPRLPSCPPSAAASPVARSRTTVCMRPRPPPPGPL